MTYQEQQSRGQGQSVQGGQSVNHLYISPEDKPPVWKPVYWHHTSSAINDNNFEPMEHINSNDLWSIGTNWWEAYQGRFNGIEKLEVVGDLPSFDFIRQLTHLKSLSIIASTTFNNLACIEGLEQLRFLQVFKCEQLEDISPIITLRNKQAEQPGILDKLSNINLTACNISSLEPFRADKGITTDELHLGYNHIKDITPLGVMPYTYLDLSHNEIENIESLFASPEANYYGINLRHNLIIDISKAVIHPVQIPGKIKLWIAYNQIPCQQLLKLKSNDYIWLMDD